MNEERANDSPASSGSPFWLAVESLRDKYEAAALKGYSWTSPREVAEALTGILEANV